jgi:hypothetical protein
MDSSNRILDSSFNPPLENLKNEKNQESNKLKKEKKGRGAKVDKLKGEEQKTCA